MTSEEWRDHLDTVCAYAFFQGEMRGLTDGLRKGWITLEAFLIRYDEAERRLRVKLDARKA
jgi:hypothetical protein